jgi:hypothetical protein
MEENMCWWCVHPHENNLPFHLPIKYNDRLDQYKTIGNFCSWKCAKAYALAMDSARKGEILSILSMMRMKACGKYEPLWPAPKRETLKCFGGKLTIEEFRNFGGKIEPPVVHWPFEHKYTPTIGLEKKHEISQSSTSEKAKLQAIENSVETGDTFKLKREKPLARASSKLENSLGIVRKAK